MEKLQTLSVALEDTKAAAREILGAASADKRPLSQTERTSAAALTAQIETIERELAAEREQVAHNRDHAPAVNWPAGEGPRDRGDVEDDEAPALGNLPKMPARSARAIERLFAGVPSRPAAEVREKLRSSVLAILGGQSLHPDIVAASQTEGVGSEGGYMVASEVSRDIFRRSLEQSVYVRAGCRIEPMISDQKLIPAWDDADETNDAEAAIVAHWTSEAEAMTPQVARMRAIELRAKKLSCIAAASAELAEDAPDFLPALETVLSNAIAKKFDRSVLTGGGAAEPMGILASSATVSVAKEVAPAQPASTILWPNIVKMWAALAPGLHEEAVWLAHPTTLPQLLNLQVKVLNQAGAEYVGGSFPGVFESGRDGTYRMLGRPVYITSRVKVLGQPGDLILFAPSQIAIGIRRSIELARSPHVYFASDQIAVRARFRGDVSPLWNTTRTLVGSGGTVGFAVVIAVRS